MTHRLAAAAGLALAIACLSTPVAGRQRPAASPTPAPALVTPTPIAGSLARTIDPVIDALWSRFSRRSAMGHVVYISQFWRLSGNLGYDATITRIHDRLLAAGFQERSVERARASEPRERSGDRGAPASERVGGAAGAKPPGSS